MVSKVFTTLSGILALVALFAIACDSGSTDTTSAGGASQAVASPAAEPTPKAGGDAGKVIATYAGKSFTDADLRDVLAKLNKRSRKALDDPERRKQYVENHIISDLIFERGKREGLNRDPEIERQLRDLERRLVIQKVMQDHQSAPVDDEEVKAYFEANPAEFTSDRVKASHILVKEEELAQEIFKQLEEDPSRFGELAKEHSIDKSNAERGGDLGLFGRGRMVKEFEEASFGLTEDGQLSAIVKTRFGYHILKRTGREDGQLKPFDDVKNQIRIRLINEKRRTQTEQFLEAIKKDAGYALDVEVLAAIDLSDMDDLPESKGAPSRGGH